MKTWQNLSSKWYNAIKGEFYNSNYKDWFKTNYYLPNFFSLVIFTLQFVVLMEQLIGICKVLGWLLLIWKVMNILRHFARTTLNTQSRHTIIHSLMQLHLNLQNLLNNLIVSSTSTITILLLFARRQYFYVSVLVTITYIKLLQFIVKIFYSNNRSLLKIQI